MFRQASSSPLSREMQQDFIQRSNRAREQPKRVIIRITGYRYSRPTATGWTSEFQVDEVFACTAMIPHEHSGESFMGRVKEQLHRQYRVDKHAITFYGAECPEKLSDSYCPSHGERIRAEFRRRRTDWDAERIRAKKKRQRRRKRRMADDPSASSGIRSRWH
eukprot:SAG11_NODE_2195_length_3699_cov_22.646919_4_plen_161_part_01